MGISFVNHQHPAQVLSASQREQVLTQMLGRTPVLTPKVHSTAWVDYTSYAVSFKYPSWANIFPTTTPSPNRQNTYQDAFSFEDMDTHEVATFLSIKGDFQTLADFPGVNLRNQQTDIYQKSNFVISGHPGLKFTKSDLTSEVSGFVLYKGYLLSFVVTGPSLENSQVLFDSMTQSLVFH